MSDQDLIMRFKAEGINTIGQLSDAIKKARVELKELGVATVEAASKKKYIEELTDVYRKHTHVSSEFSKLVREERAEQRQTNFALREGIGALQGLGIQQKLLNDVLGGAVSSFSGVSFAVKAMGERFYGLAAPIAGLVAGLFAVNKVLELQKKLTTDLAEAGQSQIKILRELGRVSDEEYRRMLMRQINLAKATKAGPGFMSVLSGWLLSGTAGAAKAAATDIINAEKTINLIEKELFDLDKSIADQKKKQTEEVKKQADEYSKLLKEQAAWLEGQEKYEGLLGIRLPMQAQSGGEQFQQTHGGGLGVNIPKAHTGLITSTKPAQKNDIGLLQGSLALAMINLEDEFDSLKATTRSFENGIMYVTDGLTQSFEGLLKGTKNLGNVINEFANTVVDAIIKIAAETASRSIVGGLLGLVFPSSSVASANSMGLSSRYSGSPTGSLSQIGSFLSRLKPTSPEGVFTLSRVGEINISRRTL